MKKINFIILFFALVFFNKNSMAFVAHVTGPSTVCPGAIQTFNSDFNLSSGFITQIVWTCGGSGVFQINNTNTYVQSTSLNNSSAVVVWANTNGVTSWVQATYYYTIGVLNYTNTAVESVDLGLVSTPSAINSFSSLCINNSNSYTVSCPTALPAIASTGDGIFPGYSTNSYVWSATNATISGSGSSVTLTCISTNNNPIVVSVKFYSTCGYYSGTFSKTITRATSAPAMPIFSSSNKLNNCVGIESRWTVVAVSGADSYTWSTISSGVTLIPDVGGLGCTITGTVGTKIIKVKSNNTCASSVLNTANDIVSNTGVCGPRSDISRIEPQIADEVNVFPNPVSDNLTININSGEIAKYSITLYDINGKKMSTLVKSIEIGSNQATIDVSSLSNGIYFLNIDNGTDIQKQKIAVVH